jgi:hypothetical protein
MLEGYQHVTFPNAGRPSVIVSEMMSANHYLSGIGFKNSYPKDYRNIFDSESQARIESLQALFKGTTEYQEVARFREGYFMPEYIMSDHLIGNHSRNYVSEIIIFLKEDELNHN